MANEALIRHVAQAMRAHSWGEKWATVPMDPEDNSSDRHWCDMAKVAVETTLTTLRHEIQPHLKRIEELGDDCYHATITARTTTGPREVEIKGLEPDYWKELFCQANRIEDKLGAGE